MQKRRWGIQCKKRKKQKFANCFQLRIHLEVESHPMVVGWTSAPMGITVVLLGSTGMCWGYSGVYRGASWCVPWGAPMGISRGCIPSYESVHRAWGLLPCIKPLAPAASIGG